MKNVKVVLVSLSVVLNGTILAAGGMVVARKGGLPWVLRQIREASTGREGPAGNLRLSLFERLPHGPNDVFMVGDSITEMAGDWDVLLGCSDVQNRGIGGDTTAGVLGRLDEIVSRRPCRVFLMVGVNDLQRGWPVAEIAGRYEQILDRLCAESPETTLVVQSVLPVNRYLYRQYITAGHPGIHMPQAPDIRDLNAKIRAMAEDRGCLYVDLWPAMVEGEDLAREYTFDGLHVNGAGYVAWAETIAGLVRQEKPSPSR